jgi:hypothetical protein
MNLIASSVKSTLISDILIKISNVESLKLLRNHNLIRFNVVNVRSASFDSTETLHCLSYLSDSLHYALNGPKLCTVCQILQTIYTVH